MSYSLLVQWKAIGFTMNKKEAVICVWRKATKAISISVWIAKKKRTAFIPFPSYNHLEIKVFSSKMKYMETWIPKILLHSLHFLFCDCSSDGKCCEWQGIKRSKVYVISSRGTRRSWCTDLNKKLCQTQNAVLVYLLQCFKSGIWKIKTTNFNRKMSYQTTLNVIMTPF